MVIEEISRETHQHGQPSLWETQHDKELNLRILGSWQVQHQSAACQTESISVHKSCKADRPVKFWLAPYFFFLSIIPKFKPRSLDLICVLPKDLLSVLTPRHMWSLIWNLYMGCSRFLMLCFILLASMVSMSDAGLVKTNQTLAPDCYAWFTDYRKECPIKAEWDPALDDQWGYLNETCCAGFPGTELHCQRKDGSEFPACLPDQTAGKGKAWQLTVGNDGNPQFISVPCGNTTYNPHVTVSSNVTFPYCLLRKIRCSGVGEVLLCHGGTDADDMCTCSQGYRPVGSGCGHYGNFTGQDECLCERLTCAASEVAMRTPLIQTGSCRLMKSHVPPQFSCVKVPTVTGPSTHVPSQDTSVESEATDPTEISQPKLNATDGSSVPPRKVNPKDDDGIGFHFGYGVLALFIAVVFLILIVVAVTRCSQRKACSLPSYKGVAFRRLADV